MWGGKDARGGLLAVVTACAAMACFAAPAQAADCQLSGSGLEASSTDTSLYQVPGAQLKASMIFVDFSDHPSAVDETQPQNTIGLDLVAWATDYVDEVSYGRTQLDVQMGTTWIRMGSPSTSYDFTSFAAQRAFIAEAVQKADTAGFDFAGRQTVYVVPAPTSGELPNSPAFHAFAGDAIVADGTQIRWGASMGDDIRRTDLDPDYGSHILVHETGHTFGLPDLYRFGQPFETAHPDAGAWDLMGWIGPGLHMTAWHKRKLGWLAASEWTCVEGTVTAQVNPLSTGGGTKMLLTRASPSVAYVAEVREPVGHDSGICDAGGVLIYRVDANAATGFLSGVPPLQVKLAHPEAPGDPDSIPCGALSNAAFGVGPGETSHFSEAGVTIDVLSGSPALGYSIRMTGPVLQDGAVPPKKKCKKGQKLKKVKKKLKCVKKKKRKRR
jgi:M6 family metalloprotease-like protein